MGTAKEDENRKAVQPTAGNEQLPAHVETANRCHRATNDTKRKMKESSQSKHLLINALQEHRFYKVKA